MGAKKLIEGYWDSFPKIAKIAFPSVGKLQVTLEDKRAIIVPLSQFPSIKKLKPTQRKKWYLFGNGFSFDDCDEVYHVEQILGNFNNYKHENKSE